MARAEKPNTCFWELTRACRLDCDHCRVHAALPDADELSPAEALRVADELIELGVGCVVLTGGEPILYSGWEDVARRLSGAGVRVRLFLSGFGFTDQTRDRALGAGVKQFAVSIDGPRGIHDRLRPGLDRKVLSTFDSAVSAVHLIREAGADLRAVTQVNAINARFLLELYRLLADLAIPRWQIHLCQMSGSAQARRAELMPQPGVLEDVIKVLVLAARERKVHAPMHCTIGYMTAEEPVLRNRAQPGRMVWDGCGAGLTTMSISPSGALKGCVTLPEEFSTGNVRDRKVAEWWRDDAAFPYARGWKTEMLAGECAHCAFGATCRAGCRSVAYLSTGAIGANPYCLKIVRETAAR